MITGLFRIAGVQIDRSKALVVSAILLVTFLAAMDGTIVDTTMPTIIGALGGVALYSWVFSAYLLTSTTTVPIYGKLADLFGRKRVLLIGSAMFILGSALCGQAQSMVQLIIFRGIQGLGAGCIIPITQVIIGDLFSPIERAKMQGLFSSVWGISALVGPLLGAFIVKYISWRWIFYLNMPLGGIGLWMIAQHLKEKLQGGKPAIDYYGAAGLTAATTCLMLATFLVGLGYTWGSTQVAGLLIISIAVYAATLWWENRAPEPMLPLNLFAVPALTVAVIASFMAGAVMIGMTVYLPLYTQGVEGGSAVDAGLVLMPLSLGWPVASFLGGRLILKLGYRTSAMLGMLLQVVAAGYLALFGGSQSLSPWVLRTLMFAVGGGMGFCTLAFILIAQGAVGWNQRGVATASVTFIRTLGQTIGISAMGTALNLQLLRHLRAIPDLVPANADASAALSITNQLLDPHAWGALGSQNLAAMRTAMASSLHSVHYIILLLSVLGLVSSFFVPDTRPELAPSRSAGAGH